MTGLFDKILCVLANREEISKGALIKIKITINYTRTYLEGKFKNEHIEIRRRQQQQLSMLCILCEERHFEI